MALAETANLVVKLSLGGNFVSQIGKATKGLNTFDKSTSRAFRAGEQIGTGIKRGAVLATAGLAILGTQVAQGLQSLIRLEGMTAQTEAVLKSTGGIAGVTATEVRKLAEEFEGLNATVGDEVIQNAENLLLTFTKVNKRAFKPALQAALDMNQALGGGPEGLAGTTKLLGKALQDPEKGLSRLGRAVGGFSDETIKAVKEAVKNNDTLKAQGIILAELEKRYGGSFARAGDTAAGSVAKLSDAWEDLQRVGATALLPTVRNVADALTDLLADPEVQKGAEELGKSIASLFTKDNIKSGIGAIREGAGFLLTIAREVGGVVKIAVDAFRSLPPELQKLAVGAFAVNKLTGGLVTNLAGGLIGAVLSSFKGVMTVNAGVVNVNGGIGGGGGLPGKVATAAAGAAGIGAGALALTVGTLILAPAAVAALGLAITKATDPEGRRTLEGRAATARGRGVPDWNNAALQELRKLNANLNPSVGNFSEGQVAPLQDAFDRATIPTTNAVDSLKGKIADDLATVKAATDTAGRNVSLAATTAGFAVAGAERAGASSIVSAIYAARPIVTTNVSVSSTSVNHSSTVVNRYGSTGGSRVQDGSGVLHNGAD